MFAFQYEFRQALEALACGRMTVDSVLVLARQDPEDAKHEISKYLGELSLAGQLRPPATNIIELAWRHIGPTSCLNFDLCGIQPSSAVEQFLLMRLKQAPGEFADVDLQLALHRFGNNNAIAAAIKNLRADRLTQKAAELSRVPQELNRDVAQLKTRVSSYSFPSDLIDLLDKVESGIAAGGDAFDQAAMIGHLRSFFESLHSHVGNRLRTEKPATLDGTDLTKCGQAIDYLHRKVVLTDEMRTLGRGLYAVLSGHGVHAISAEREYVRLCRNMVVEYGLVLFYELERRLAEP